MTNEELDAIEARANAATQGPWSHEVFDEPSRCVGYANGFVCTTNHGNDEANADFIAHAREDVPALIARLRSAEEREATFAQRAEFLAARNHMLAADLEELRKRMARMAALEEPPHDPDVLAFRVRVSKRAWDMRRDGVESALDATLEHMRAEFHRYHSRHARR